jgi:uncharacterized protein YqgV (UPF0045/DUF77 family)
MKDPTSPVSAQISLYPLRQTSLAEPIDDLLRTLRSRGLDVRPGAMSALVVGESRALFDALEQAFREAAERGEVVLVATVSNACPIDPESSGSG